MFALLSQFEERVLQKIERDNRVWYIKTPEFSSIKLIMKYTTTYPTYTLKLNTKHIATYTLSYNARQCIQ